MTQAERRIIDFSIFVFYRLAERWNKSVPETYHILADSGVLDSYIIGCFDTLHTLGAEYLVDDITDLIRKRGIAI